MNANDRAISPQEALQHLVVASGANSALLVTREGHNVAAAGNLTGLDTTALAVLIAGMFTATREVARLIGERKFSILLQQGEKRHLHISLVSEAAMLVIIFEDYQRIGLVRHEARKAGAHLAELLETKGHPAIAGRDKELAVSAFREYALNLLDRLFEVN